MNRRGFLRGLLSSTAAVVVAPACVMDELDELLDRSKPPKTFFDMGRDPPYDAWSLCDPQRWLLGYGAVAVLFGGMMFAYGKSKRARAVGTELALQGAVPILQGATP